MDFFLYFLLNDTPPIDLELSTKINSIIDVTDLIQDVIIIDSKIFSNKQ